LTCEHTELLTREFVTVYEQPLDSVSSGSNIDKSRLML